jgi:hypothetical protein
MNAFTSEWLALRRPIDERSRWHAGADRFLQALPADRPWLVDLACGTGANCAYLASRLQTPRDWMLVDNDPLLLQRAQDDCRFMCTVERLECRRLDLARELPRLDLGEACGVTASALLDLVSGRWLDELFALCARWRPPLLFSLTYAGHVQLSPGDVDDDLMQRAFNTHQRLDKGFGPALGPIAPAIAARMLRLHGYRVSEATSDWRLDSARDADAALLYPLLQGWAAAASEVEECGVTAERAQQWLHRREQATASRTLTARIGHVDLLALP